MEHKVVAQYAKIGKTVMSTTDPILIGICTDVIKNIVILDVNGESINTGIHVNDFYTIEYIKEENPIKDHFQCLVEYDNGLIEVYISKSDFAEYESKKFMHPLVVGLVYKEGICVHKTILLNSTKILSITKM